MWWWKGESLTTWLPINRNSITVQPSHWLEHCRLSRVQLWARLSVHCEECHSGGQYPISFPLSADKNRPRINPQIHYIMPGLDPRTDVVTHVCMNQTIQYNDTIPVRWEERSFMFLWGWFLNTSTLLVSRGNHRPIWANFGEYLYVPVQRWLHNLEVFLTIFSKLESEVHPAWLDHPSLSSLCGQLRAGKAESSGKFVFIEASLSDLFR